jgi:kynureninase
MARRRRPEQQLALDWTDAMQWQDLPAPIRERAGPLLGALLREAAVRASEEPEGGRDE